MRYLVALLILLVPASAAAQMIRRNTHPTEVVGLPTPMDLLIGRFPRHIPEYVPESVPPPPPAGTYEALAWRVRFGGGTEDAGAYVALSDWHAAHGEDDLAWWAAKRALELGAPDANVAALRQRLEDLSARWKAAGRKDPPTDEHYRFVRGGADRWVQAFQIAEKQAFSGKEHVGDEAVQRRLGEQADMQVPPAILGADSFMRRWGVALLIASVAFAFWTLYLVAILRKRRRGPVAA